VLGNHAVKFGADIRRVRDDLLQGNNNAAAGTFYFSENQTSAPGGNTTGQANDIASVLFDVPYQVGQDTNSTFPCYRQTWLFFFAADKWQATPKLTIDLGLRYELYPPATPRKPGGFVSYNPATNQLVLAGEDGNPSNIGLQTSTATWRRASASPTALRRALWSVAVSVLATCHSLTTPTPTTTRSRPAPSTPSRLPTALRSTRRVAW
jgi:hypothetical protein